MSSTRPLKVFLCHASADKPVVRKLCQRLSAEGWVDPWLDEEKLALGQYWSVAIEEALDAADVVLIFLSRNSVNKEGFVQRELTYAWELSLEKPWNVIFLIPFRLDDCEVPRFLRTRQWGDFFGDEEENAYRNLMRSLKQRYQQKLQLEAEEREQGDVAKSAAHEKTERDRIQRKKAERIVTENYQKILGKFDEGDWIEAKGLIDQAVLLLRKSEQENNFKFTGLREQIYKTKKTLDDCIASLKRVDEGRKSGNFADAQRVLKDLCEKFPDVIGLKDQLTRVEQEGQEYKQVRDLYDQLYTSYRKGDLDKAY